MVTIPPPIPQYPIKTVKQKIRGVVRTLLDGAMSSRWHKLGSTNRCIGAGEGGGVWWPVHSFFFLSLRIFTVRSWLHRRGPVVLLTLLIRLECYVKLHWRVSLCTCVRVCMRCWVWSMISALIESASTSVHLASQLCNATDLYRRVLPEVWDVPTCLVSVHIKTRLSK